MANFPFGLSSIKTGGIDAVTGLPTSLVSVGNVLRNSAELTQDDAQMTEHFAELKSDPIAVVTRNGKRLFRFTLMDVAADTVVIYAGGSVTAGPPDVWNAPTAAPNIEKSFEITTLDGTVITINRGKVTAKVTGQASEEGRFVVEVMVTPLTPLVADVPAFTIEDPA